MPEALWWFAMLGEQRWNVVLDPILMLPWGNLWPSMSMIESLRHMGCARGYDRSRMAAHSIPTCSNQDHHRLAQREPRSHPWRDGERGRLPISLDR